jgi:hypothetical protein
MTAQDIEAATDLQERVYSAIPPFTRTAVE